MSKKRAARRSAASETTSGAGLGTFVAAFVGVLALGGLGLAAWWVWLGPGAAPEGGAAPAAADAASPRVAEAGTWFTADGDPGIGDPDAPVTIVEFSDYQCPNCRQFAEEVLPWLKDTWIRQGIVKVIFRDFAIRGPDSLRAAVAAHCAGEQGRYWSYHDALFASYGEGDDYGDEALLALAPAVGVDAESFADCLDSGRHEARVAASTQFGHGQGYEGTPTFVINGRQAQGAIAIADWEALFRIYADELGLEPPAP